MKLNDIYKNLRNNKLYIVLILLLVILFTLISYYYYKKYIKVNNYIDNKEFTKDSKDDKKVVTLYLFYTNWCPHCKVAKPEWEKIKTKTNGSINNHKIIFKEVDCDKDNETADKFKINGYPTIKLIHNNKIYNYDAKPSESELMQFLNVIVV